MRAHESRVVGFPIVYRHPWGVCDSQVCHGKAMRCGRQVRLVVGIRSRRDVTAGDVDAAGRQVVAGELYAMLVREQTG